MSPRDTCGQESDPDVQTCIRAAHWLQPLGQASIQADTSNLATVNRKWSTVSWRYFVSPFPQRAKNTGRNLESKGEEDRNR